MVCYTWMAIVLHYHYAVLRYCTSFLFAHVLFPCGKLSLLWHTSTWSTVFFFYARNLSPNLVKVYLWPPGIKIRDWFTIKRKVHNTKKLKKLKNLFGYCTPIKMFCAKQRVCTFTIKFTQFYWLTLTYRLKWIANRWQHTLYRTPGLNITFKVR